MIDKVVTKTEFCASCALTLAGLGVVLHTVYFALAFVSVATGAFLGVIGVMNWWRGRRSD